MGGVPLGTGLSRRRPGARRNNYKIHHWRTEFMKSLKQILDAKGHEVWTIAPDALVFDAVSLMAEKKVGALLVKDGETLVGIISERDYARKIALQGRSSRDCLVSEIMTKRVIFAQPDETVEQCMALMTEKRIRHLPVIENGKLLGIISVGDLVKAIIEDQQFVIDQLVRYITG